MALYNVSISVQGLKYISENSGLLHLIWTLLDGRLAIRKHTDVAHNGSLLPQYWLDVQSYILTADSHLGIYHIHETTTEAVLCVLTA